MRSRGKAELNTNRVVPSTKPKDLKSPKGRNDKTKGELAEAIFTVKAEALGIALSTPLGDNQGFDFMATSTESRVQRAERAARARAPGLLC